MPITAQYDSARQYSLRVRDLPPEMKPREKLIKYGSDALSLSELLAVVFVTGNRDEGVLAMSSRVMREYGARSVISDKSPSKLSKSLGIPMVKACQMVAIGEIGRRLYDRRTTGFVTVRNAREVYGYLKDIRDLSKEHFRGLYLNSHNRIIHDEVISVGTVNENLVHPREVFRPAIEHSASAIIVAHNHPSGSLAPSKEDVIVTEELVSAGKMLGIKLLDHVIVTRSGFVSIKTKY